jgi:hypothetical protein
MTAFLIIGGIVLFLVLSSNSDRYSSRYDNYNHSYPPPPPHYYPMSHYDPSQEYYRYRAERTRQSLGYTAIFIIALFIAMFLFSGGTAPEKMPPQNISNVAQPPPRVR